MVQFDQEALKVGLRTARGPKQAAGGAHESTAPEAQSQYKYKKNVFLKEGGSGAGTHDRFGRELGIKSEFVALDEHIAEEFKIFLSNHVANLLQLNEERPDLLNNMAHLHDRLVFDYLTTEKVTADGRAEREMVDTKIADFLKSGEGWKITNQILEEQTALRLFGLGLMAAANPEGHRSFYPNEVAVPLNIDQGTMNRQARLAAEWFNQHLNGAGGRPGEPQGQFGPFRIWPNWARRWHMASALTAGSGIGATIGAFIGGPVGALAGGAVPWAGAGIWHSLSNGVMMDVRQTSAGLNLIKNNPAEADYLLKMTGIDVGDFQATGPDQIDFARPPEDLRTQRRVDEIRREAVGNIFTRMEFYAKIGVPLEDLDVSPFQRLFNSQTGAVEQTGTRWQDREQDIFNQLGGFQDGAGNIVGTGGYDLLVNGVDTEGNAARQLQAERQVTTEMMQKIIQREASNTASIETATSSMTTKRSEIATPQGEINDAYRIRRTEALGRERTRLEGDATITNAERVGFDTYNTTVDTLNTARTALANELATIYGGAFTDPDAAITALRAVTSQYGTDITINGDLIESTRQRLAGINPWQQAEYADVPSRFPRLPGETDEDLVERRRLARRDIDEEAETRRTAIQRDVTRINNELIPALERLKSGVTAAQTSLENNEEGRPARDLADRLQSWQRNFNEITGWSNPPANVLDTAFLAAGDIDAIIARINTANSVPGVPLGTGWPATRNNDEVFRRRVVQAVLEARAQVAEAADAARPGRLPDYATLTSWNISENQLRYLTNDQINARVNAEFTRSAGANGWDAAGNADPANIVRIDNARQEAQNRVQTRLDTVNNQNTALNLQVENVETQINAQNLDGEVRLMDTAIALSGRQVDLIKNRGQIIDNVGRFTDRTVITGDRTYTQSERDVLPLPRRGYYEFMNFLFNYREKSTRDADFRRYSQVLTPDRLRQFILEAIPILGIPPTNSLNTAFERLENEITVTRNVDDRDMANLVFLIERTFREEALAVE